VRTTAGTERQKPRRREEAKGVKAGRRMGEENVRKNSSKIYKAYTKLRNESKFEKRTKSQMKPI
jgi:hypothetical protein